MTLRSQFSSLLEQEGGILRMAPCWVPRSFMVPGGRLRLHPDDLYALGAHRGGINERWFCSTTHASNGPGTPDDEGLSYVYSGDRQFLFRNIVAEIGDELLGAETMTREGGWSLLCKFFDNLGAIPHHLHQSEEFAKLVGQKGKPEAYYFPPQYNQKANLFPYTFMGLEPGTTREQVRRCLADWNKGDNGIVQLSKAYRLQPGTGWQIDPGILHAPGSFVTYEPQVNSDVFSMFQSMVDGRYVDRSLLVKDVLPEYWNDLDYLVGMMDWEANVDPEFAAHRRAFPRLITTHGDRDEMGFEERWICYGTPSYSAKEVTVLPLRHAHLRDSAAYGLILTQGHGTIGGKPVATPTMIRFRERTQDELFVSVATATQGVLIENSSETEALVFLKHFGPGNPDATSLIQ